jgi:Reverse transcriptase (RNA-dependent DNA polymerase).
MVDGDKEKWIEAAEIKIRSLESKNTWIEVPKSSSKSRILPGTWVFHRKRYPDGSIRKYKARYCVRGDLHDQVTDTFAPAIAFSMVRIFLITSIMFKWHTCSIDFSNAFVQAKLDEDMWIHLPRGFHGEMKDSCLKLQRSLYVIATAPISGQVTYSKHSYPLALVISSNVRTKQRLLCRPRTIQE